MDARLRQHLATLLVRGQRGMALGLDRVEDALRALGDPHLAAPGIVVAGTNGKGSVCAMLDAIGRRSGLRVGLTTSPHLARFAERIQIDGAPIADGAFADALGRVLDTARGDLTFFETLTCAAFVAFAEAKVELTVLEVGLGGRLDATNVLPRPLATAITSIAEGDGKDGLLEHAALLGGTVSAIAREKAGILRAGAPCVLGPLAPRARAAVLDVAREAGVVDLFEVVREAPGDGVRPVRAARLTDGRVAITIEGASIAEAHLGLHGEHQVDNAAVAAATAWCAGAALPALRTGIAAGLGAARWPGRMERLESVEASRGGGVAIWLDAAHNVDGARALARTWRGLGIGPERTVLVFGALVDKAFEAVLGELAPLAERRVYTSPKGRAAAPLAALAAVAPGAGVDEPAAAVEHALAICRPGDAVIVAGSIYLVGEVRAHLRGEARDPPIAL